MSQTGSPSGAQQRAEAAAAARRAKHHTSAASSVATSHPFGSIQMINPAYVQPAYEVVQPAYEVVQQVAYENDASYLQQHAIQMEQQLQV